MKSEWMGKKDTPALISRGLPVVVGAAGEKAQYKFVEFFTNTIANENTRQAYARAVYRFLGWCEAQGLELEAIHPVAVGGYIRGLELEVSPATVKQHLAAIRMLFDWFVVEGVTSYNPASSVKGPKHNPKRGLTPILTAKETRQLFDSFEDTAIKDVRDKAILGVLFYAWVRVSSCVQLNVGDYYHSGRDGFLKFKEKGGKRNTIPAHHKAAHYIDVYISRAGIDPLDKRQKKQPLFRTVYRRNGQLTERRLHRNDILRMIKARASEAGITAPITAHSPRGTGITTFLENGGQLEQAQSIANHADPRTTRLYDRRGDRIERADIERVQY